MTEPSDRTDVRDRPVLVWDVPVRLFHWAVALLIPVLYVTWRLNWMDWHAQAGYVLLALLLFRVLWGVFGSDTARFSRFLRSPSVSIRYLARLHRREPDTIAGHNPAGGWMVILMLGLMLGETLTGVYVNNDVADEGPLTEIVPARITNLITDLHGAIWDGLLLAVVMHLAAITFYTLIKGHNLVRAMVVGHKRLPARVPRPHVAGTGRALVLLLLAVCATALIVFVS